MPWSWASRSRLWRFQQAVRRRREGGHGEVGQGPRWAGRPGRGRQGRGRAQRHRASAGLGQLRRDHRGVQRPSTASRSTAPTRTAPARTRSTRSSPSRARSARRTCSTSAPRSRCPVPRRGCSRRTRSRPGTTIPDSLKEADGLWFGDYGGYISIGCDAKRITELPEDVRRPEEARVQGQGRAQRQPDQGRCGVRRRLRGGARQRRQLRQHQAGHRLLRRAEEERQLHPGGEHPGHRREGRDADLDRLGLPQRRLRRAVQGQGRRLAGRRPHRRHLRQLLLPGRSARTPRTRRRPGSGRSSCTATRARTCG